MTSARCRHWIACSCQLELTATRRSRSSPPGSAGKAHQPAEDIFQNVGKGETAYEAAFEDLARIQGAAFAKADASILFYVIDPARLQGADWFIQDWLSPLLLAMLGAAFVYGLTHLKLARRPRFEPIRSRPERTQTRRADCPPRSCSSSVGSAQVWKLRQIVGVRACTVAGYCAIGD